MHDAWSNGARLPLLPNELPVVYSKATALKNHTEFPPYKRQRALSQLYTLCDWSTATSLEAERDKVTISQLEWFEREHSALTPLVRAHCRVLSQWEVNEDVTFEQQLLKAEAHTIQAQIGRTHEYVNSLADQNCRYALLTSSSCCPCSFESWKRTLPRASKASRTFA